MCHKQTTGPFSSPTAVERITLTTTLNNTDLRATWARIKVLHFLNITDIPVTAEMVSRCVDLPLSTTYRALSALEEHRLAGVTFSRGNVTRWFRLTLDTTQHCPACGQCFHIEYA